MNNFVGPLKYFKEYLKTLYEKEFHLGYIIFVLLICIIMVVAVFNIGKYYV